MEFITYNYETRLQNRGRRYTIKHQRGRRVISSNNERLHSLYQDIEIQDEDEKETNKGERGAKQIK